MTQRGARPTGPSTVGALRANPRALGRFIDFVLRLVAVFAVAWVVYDKVAGALATLSLLFHPR